MTNRIKLLTLIKEYADMKYSDKGQRRSDNTMLSYSSLYVWFKNYFFTKNHNINVIAYNLSGKRGLALKEAQKIYKMLSQKIREASANNSESTLSMRLKMIYMVLSKAERDFGIITGKQYFTLLKTEEKDVIVINNELHSLAIRRAINYAERQVLVNTKDRIYVGALAYILLSFTSARPGSLRNWSFKNNFIFDDDQSFLIFKDEKVKYKTIEIPIPRRVALILKTHNANILSSMIFNCYSYTHISTCFREFLMTIPEFSNKQIKIKVKSGGNIIHKKVELYKYYTPHKVRSTFN